MTTGKAIVFAEVHKLGMEFGVVPVHVLDGARGVIKHNHLGNAPQTPKGVLQHLNKAFDREPGNRLAIALRE
jgi:hypothetical protein